MRIRSTCRGLYGRTENFCDVCDSVVSVSFAIENFWNFKVGRARCPTCGAIVLPCNECFGTNISDRFGCAKCPWRNSSISKEKDDTEDCCCMMPVPHGLA